MLLMLNAFIVLSPLGFLLNTVWRSNYGTYLKLGRFQVRANATQTE